jgi:hypothetical protein
VSGFKVASLIVSRVVLLCYGWVVCGFIGGLRSACLSGV